MRPEKAILLGSVPEVLEILYQRIQQVLINYKRAPSCDNLTSSAIS